MISQRILIYSKDSEANGLVMAGPFDSLLEIYSQMHFDMIMRHHLWTCDCS